MRMSDAATDVLVLDCDDDRRELAGSTLVVAIDDTGHEAFADSNFPVFGLGGCCFLVKDYRRLIDGPWNFMCQRFFPEHKRPMHAADLWQPTDEQLDAFRHFFEKFQFFRVATTISKQAANEIHADFISVVGASLLSRIADVGKWAEFDRLFIIVEQSDRIQNRILRSLDGGTLHRDGKNITIELGHLPKSACMAALEVADFIIHTAGAQTRNRIAGNVKPRIDFEIIFRNVPEFLTSFMEITKISQAENA